MSGFQIIYTNLFSLSQTTVFCIQNFSPNPYFEDTRLTKTFTFLDEGTTKVTATSIKWKEGMVSSRSLSFEVASLLDVLLWNV